MGFEPLIHADPRSRRFGTGDKPRERIFLPRISGRNFGMNKKGRNVAASVQAKLLQLSGAGEPFRVIGCQPSGDVLPKGVQQK